MGNLKKILNEHWVGFVPILLLLLVSANQVYLYNVDFLNPWKGGGFGMFSKIQTRYFHIHLIYKGGLECAEPHSDYMRQLKKVSNYPNYLHLENLTRKMSQKIWVYTYGYMGSKKPTSVRMIGEKESLQAQATIIKLKNDVESVLKRITKLANSAHKKHKKEYPDN